MTYEADEYGPGGPLNESVGMTEPITKAELREMVARAREAVEEGNIKELSRIAHEDVPRLASEYEEALRLLKRVTLDWLMSGSEEAAYLRARGLLE